MALRAVAEKLEHESRTKGLVAVSLLVAAVKTEFGRAQGELSQLLKR